MPPFLLSSFDKGESNPSGANTNYNGGSKVFVASRSDLTIPAGEEIDIPMVLNLAEYSQYHLYYVVNQDILVTVEWINSSERGAVVEKMVPLTASTPDGAILQGRVQARHVRIRIQNNAIPGPGSDITSVYLAIFGIR